ncbi:MAG: CDP-diacylglycerol--glycerol-3-phosphate 3-phosphatidyltransferase [Devosia nanyangense]|uniref:CDP-diacylglycerol--glycerol-3-phosphate 3-phosphatidyltransferase n=1 Tax=Devosia nanyangense TaxID=1228055 RepID=A0A933NZ23_9HYPH|nr:CDP-diacylglycerol--glycerol-3-phosphate 3-phosphatidyltransferase [Devosia nanyangense]
MEIPAALRTLPNQLTLARIAAIPVLCLLIGIGVDWLRWIALILFVLAAITDWFDGFLARRMNLMSDLGKMLDPIADKLLVGALIVTFAFTRDFNGLDLVPAIAILLREIFISGLREFMGNRAVSVPVTFLAKWKTTAQLVALFFVIVDGLLPSFGFISSLLLWIAGGLTVWTGWQYLRSMWPYFSSPTE